MKNLKLVMMSLGLVMVASGAEANMSLEHDVEKLREDVTVLQRQLYREKQGGLSPASAQSVSVKMGEFDESLRQAVGKVDELEYRLNELTKRLEMMNKDIDIRFKMFEGKPIENIGGGVSAKKSKKFKAPVAKNAPKSILGDSITKGEDLKPVKTKSAEEIYKQAMADLNSNKYDAAASGFTKVMTKFPEHKLAENSQYWLGEAYYGKKDYTKAAVAFGKGLEKYKKGNKGADNYLKLGMTMQKLGKKTEACTAYKSLAKEFPQAEAETKNKAEKMAKDLKCE